MYPYFIITAFDYSVVEKFKQKIYYAERNQAKQHLFTFFFLFCFLFILYTNNYQNTIDKLPRNYGNITEKHIINSSL